MLTRRSLTPATLSLFAGFAVMSVLVVLQLTLPADEAILHWVGSIRQPWLTDWMLFFTFVGNGLIEVPFALVAAYLLWRLGRPLCSKRFVFAALSAEVIYFIAKASFQRDRPRIIERLGDAGWYSYPSGHAMLAPVIYGFGLILLAQSVQSRGLRIVLLALAGTLPPLIAVSRVYLGVHYPSDILGALLLGTAWVLLWTEVRAPSDNIASTSSAPSAK